MAQPLFKLCTLSLLLGLTACSDNTETVQPKYTSLTESVYASGTLAAEDQYQVYPTISGIVEEWLVEEDDTVTVGTQLVNIKGDNSTLNAENARLAVKQARDNLAPNSPILTELKLNIETARLAYLNDSVNYERKKNLIEKDIGTRVDFDQAKLQFESSKNQYETAKQRLSLRKVQLQNELETAENLYRISQNNSGDFTINSKIDGKVYALYQEEGELATPQQPLALLGDDRVFLVELLIDELDISKVNKGQKVLLTLDSYGDEVFEASISKIFPLLDQRTQTIKAEATFVKAPTTLYPGLTVEANIVINEKDNALVIPTSYLLNGNKVLVNEKEEVTVEIGLRNMEYVEVLSGIDTSTVLSKPGA